MLPYWLFFMPLAFGAVTEDVNPMIRAGVMRAAHASLPWLAVVLALVLLIGCRFQVGGDWYNYLRMFDQVHTRDLLDLVTSFDPSYILVNRLSAAAGTDIVGVNLVCAAAFSLCLTYFCRTLPLPWLAMATAVPYLVIVVAMGYTRQGVALGFEMVGLVALSRRAFIWFVVWLVLGATFHKSAVLLLPLAATVSAQNRITVLAWVLAATALAYRVLLQADSDGLIESYLTAAYQSQGAFIRCLMNAVPAALFLLTRRRFNFAPVEQRIWTTMSLISLALFLAVLVTSASTAVDRVALYMLPIQLVIFSRLPLAFADLIDKRLVVCATLACYASVLFVWLNFADNAEAWLPYRSYLVP